MIFFTSDTHFFHNNIIDYCSRGFSSYEEMNDALIRNWNSRVSSDDTIYHLGDFGLGSWKKLLDIRHRLNGKIHLIAGNHDYGISESRWRSDFMFEYHRYPIELDEFLLCHYPYQDDTQGIDRYMDFRPQLSQRWLIHGHIHNRWKIKNPRQYNVGVDVQKFTPISIEELRGDVYRYEKELK